MSTERSDTALGPIVRSGLTPSQHRVLWRPFEPEAASDAELRQLVRLGLLERCSGDYFTTDEGKIVREMASA